MTRVVRAGQDPGLSERRFTETPVFRGVRPPAWRVTRSSKDRTISPGMDPQGPAGPSSVSPGAARPDLPDTATPGNPIPGEIDRATVVGPLGDARLGRP